MYEDNTFYFAATYHPAGNIIEKYEQNVKEPKKSDDNQLVN